MSEVWKALADHHEATKARSILSLFNAPGRFADFSAEADGVLLDYSKTNLDETARALLLELADLTGVAEKRDAMFRGEKINTTEGRAVLHTALRSAQSGGIHVDGADVLGEIKAMRARMVAFCAAVRSGDIAATDGSAFTDIVNIGIGGSDLGPAMATRALAPYHDGPRIHFVSNVDGAHTADTLVRLDPARTLLIIASKSFTTSETMANAATARIWLDAALGAAASMHVAAVTNAVGPALATGIDRDRIFDIQDWVGGRYSIWGSVGLPLMLAIGPENFQEFLSGGALMDQHFRDAPPDRNLPILLALVGIWHNNICLYPTRAILPYDQRLARLPAYLQQLDMESNGKRVTSDGDAMTRQTGPVVWGEAGTNGQHAFFQLLHQGTAVVPAEFLIAAEGHEPALTRHHALLKANCLAQSQALMCGRDHPEPHRRFPGNRPSVTIAYPKLTPFALGQLIALYEHRVFVEGAIWGVNSFDQWGVELGKELARSMLPLIEGDNSIAAEKMDGSTQGLIGKLGKD